MDYIISSRTEKLWYIHQWATTCNENEQLQQLSDSPKRKIDKEIQATKSVRALYHLHNALDTGYTPLISAVRNEEMVILGGQ